MKIFLLKQSVVCVRIVTCSYVLAVYKLQLAQIIYV